MMKPFCDNHRCEMHKELCEESVTTMPIERQTNDGREIGIATRIIWRLEGTRIGIWLCYRCDGAAQALNQIYRR